MDYVLEQVKEKGVVKYIQSYMEDLELTDKYNKCVKEIDNNIKYITNKDGENNIVINTKEYFKATSYNTHNITGVLECITTKIFYKNTNYYYFNHSYLCSWYPDTYKYIILENMKERER